MSGLRVRVEAAVGDRRTGELGRGWASAAILPPGVKLSFSGPQQKNIDPELSFTTTVRWGGGINNTMIQMR